MTLPDADVRMGHDVFSAARTMRGGATSSGGRRLMRCIYDPLTERHAPDYFMLRGRQAANEERPGRAARLLAGLDAVGLAVEEPRAPTMAELAAIHTPRYLDFLENGFAAWRALEDAGPEVLANVHPRDGVASYPLGIVGRAGWHTGDLACPLGAHTFDAAVRSAAAALTACDEVAAGRSAYALCRPPGHHASAEVAAGHCFLNNAAVAAAALLRSGARPAVLDIDVHHGNGTQGIFYRRADVLTVSVHADPSAFYPWFVGHAHEAGEGRGEGYNLNLPVPMKSEDGAWLEAIDRGLAEVARYGADALILSLGLDVHASDPLGALSVTTEGIERAGVAIARAGLPTLIVQEGGYLSDALADNLAAFLRGFLGSAASAS